MRCQRTAKGSFVITLLNVEHTCPRHKSRWRDHAQTSQWPDGMIGNRITRNIRVPVRELVTGFKSDYKLNTKYHQMWRAKDIVKDLYLGGQQKSYHMIPALMSQIQEFDPGSVVN